MFNTGTVVGVSANVFGGGFPRQFIASFSWGGAAGFKTFDLKKAIAVAKAAYSRRNRELDEETVEILREVFNYTWAFRQL